MTRVTIDWKGPNNGVPFKLTIYLKDNKTEAQLKEIFAERFNRECHKSLYPTDIVFVDHSFQPISFDDFEFSESLYVFACDPSQVSVPETIQSEQSLLIQSLQSRILQLEQENEKYQHMDSILLNLENSLKKALEEKKQIQEKFESAIQAKTQMKIEKSKLEKELEILKGDKKVEELPTPVNEVETQESQVEDIQVENSVSEPISEAIANTTLEPTSESELQLETQVERKSQTFKNIIKEIIDTEQDYVNDLQTLHDIYFQGLSKLVSPSDLHPIFSNIHDILNINKLLLKELQEMKEFIEIADIFKRYADFLKVYTIYCSNQEIQVRELEKLGKKKGVANFLKEAKKNVRCRQLAIDSFLFLPIQRLCKYPLFIRELVKNFDDSKDLNEAAEKINNVVNIINDRKKTTENQQKIIEISELIEGIPFELIQPARRFIMSGSLVKISNDKQQERQFFLFNDLLIYAKPSLLNKKLQYRGQVEPGGALLQDLPNQDRFMLIRKDRKRTSYTLVCKSNDEKSKWMNNIHEFIVKKKEDSSFVVRMPSTSSLKPNEEPLVANKPLPATPEERPLPPVPETLPPTEKIEEVVGKARVMDSPSGGRMSMVGNILTGWVAKMVDLVQRRRPAEVVDDEDSEFDSMARVIQQTMTKLKKDVSRANEVKIVEDEVDKLLDLARKIYNKEVALTSDIVQQLRNLKINVENAVKQM